MSENIIKLSVKMLKNGWKNVDKNSEITVLKCPKRYYSCDGQKYKMSEKNISIK